MANEIPNIMHAVVAFGFVDFGSGPQLSIVAANGIDIAACEHPADGEIIVHLSEALGQGDRAISNGFGQTTAADPAAAFVTVIDDVRYRVRPLIIGDPPTFADATCSVIWWRVPRLVTPVALPPIP